MPGKALKRPEISTIVRIINGITSCFARVSFAALERFAPSLGARCAERLWFSHQGPLGVQIRRPRALPAGQRFELTSGGSVIAGECWGSGRNVYLVHGWGGWGTQLGAFVPPLLRAGYRVIAFDMPSHGASGPGVHGRRRSNIVEFAAALERVVAAQGPAHGLLAHSMGCAAGAFAFARGLAAQRAVFIAPMADPVPYTRYFARQLGFGERVRSRLLRRIERRIGLPMTRFNVPRMASAFSVPLLVIHDREDREIPHADGEAIARVWPAASLMTTRGLGHVRILRDARVIAAAAEFLSAQTPISVPTHRKVRPSPQWQRVPSVLSTTTIQESP